MWDRIGRSLIPRSSRPTRAALSKWRVKPSAYTGGVPAEFNSRSCLREPLSVVAMFPGAAQHALCCAAERLWRSVCASPTKNLQPSRGGNCSHDITSRVRAPTGSHNHWDSYLRTRPGREIVRFLRSSLRAHAKIKCHDFLRSQ